MSPLTNSTNATVANSWKTSWRETVHCVHYTYLALRLIRRGSWLYTLRSSLEVSGPHPLKCSTQPVVLTFTSSCSTCLRRLASSCRCCSLWSRKGKVITISLLLHVQGSHTTYACLFSSLAFFLSSCLRLKYVSLWCVQAHITCSEHTIPPDSLWLSEQLFVSEHHHIQTQKLLKVLFLIKLNKHRALGGDKTDGEGRSSWKEGGRRQRGEKGQGERQRAELGRALYLKLSVGRVGLAHLNVLCLNVRVKGNHLGYMHGDMPTFGYVHGDTPTFGYVHGDTPTFPYCSKNCWISSSCESSANPFWKKKTKLHMFISEHTNLFSSH